MLKHEHKYSGSTNFHKSIICVPGYLTSVESVQKYAFHPYLLHYRIALALVMSTVSACMVHHCKESMKLSEHQTATIH